MKSYVATAAGPFLPDAHGLTHLISHIKRTFVTFFRLCNTVGTQWRHCSISVKVSERSVLAENPAESCEFCKCSWGRNVKMISDKVEIKSTI